MQFAADGGNGAGCPAGAVYGKATAYTPILEQPLEGPVYLRSSDNNLPDFVAALHGLVDVEAVARIDSKRGGIRATFEGVPDAPLTKVVVEMQGGKKGLIVNSTDLCAARAGRTCRWGQNGRRQRAGLWWGRSVGRGARRVRGPSELTAEPQGQDPHILSICVDETHQLGCAALGVCWYCR